MTTNNVVISFSKAGTGTLMYSHDAITWTEMTTTLSLSGSYTTYFKGNLRPPGNSTTGIGKFTITGQSCALSGNCMSLLFGDNARGATLNINYAFSGLFEGCTAINSISNTLLQSDIAYTGCYMRLFKDCTGLANVPADILRAKTVYPQGYYGMFEGCTKLLNAPLLPATELYASCYERMFYGCTSLLSCPMLSSTSLNTACYKHMFDGCTGIVRPPALPATVLADNCYANMFSRCSNLASAPDLPATTLASNCYYGMFQNCTSLKTAPSLQALKLEQSCYAYMFNGCSNLNFIEMMATNISATYCLSSWVSNVASSGTFVKNPIATWTITGSSGVPTGWTVIQGVPDAIKNCCVIVVHDGYVKFTFNQAVQISSNNGTSWGSIAAGRASTYSTGAMIAIKANGVISNFITTEGPGYFSLYGNAMGLLYSDNASSYSTVSGQGLSGAFMNNAHLKYVSKTFLPATTLMYNAYASMFKGCINLLSAPELPATTMTGVQCYKEMFSGCESLVNPPTILPAMSLQSGCYEYMFLGCKSMSVAPKLPATVMALDCYYGMFTECSSLSSPPELPATTLYRSCYREMFQSCGLIKTPKLPATTLTDSCYRDMFKNCNYLTTIDTISATTLYDACCMFMFYGCTSLKSAPTIHVSTAPWDCYYGMFYGCSSLTTAPALPATTLGDGCYQQMFEGCSSLQTAPTLPANTPAEGCYKRMFKDCTNLIYIKVMLKGGVYGTYQSSYTANWVDGLYYQNGTFVRHKDSTWNEGVDGKPNNWTEKKATS